MMPTVFTSPTSRPRSIGDRYTLYKRSALPYLPVVDDIVFKKDSPVESKDGKESSSSHEKDGKRQADATEESSPASETPETKKQRVEENDSQKDGQGSDAAQDAETSAGSETAAVPSGSNEDEPKVGDASVSVPAEPERDHAKQETKQESSSSTV